MPKLILIRHGQSTWNAANRFSGWVDVPLNSVGRREAIAAAKKVCQFKIDVCFTSLLMRAKETAAICLTEGEGNCSHKSPVFKHDADDPDWCGWDKYDGQIQEEIPIYTTAKLDERYYGDLQGYSKAEMAEKVGADTVQQWRRSFATRPPGGESLEDTAARTIPFFKEKIMPYLRAENNVLVAAHGNSLRSIIMYLDQLQPEEVPRLELSTGVPLVYTINQDGNILEKEILN
ncbi:MAG: 2,3-bisphosphoglycerate-dependent phosphoglycerate mutase [Cyanobacteria bacterium P01_G01_bin.67]